MDERLKQLRDAMVFFSAERMATKEELASLEKRMDQSDLWTRVVFGTLFTTMAATLLKLFLG